MNQKQLNKYAKEALRLYDDHRVREAMVFFRKTANETGMPQNKINCLNTLMKLYMFDAGDGDAARETARELLDIMDSDMSIITGYPMYRPMMETIYAYACDIFATHALSYEEFDEYMEKMKVIGPHSGEHVKRIQSIQTRKENGQSWTANMVLRASYKPGENFRDGAAALCSLILKHRRELRLRLEDFSNVVKNYSIAVYTGIKGYLDYCHIKRIPIFHDNYMFIIEDAETLLRKCKEDGRELDVLEGSLTILDNARYLLLSVKQAKPSRRFLI